VATLTQDATVYLDTHVVVWLYGQGASAISEAAAEALRGASRRLFSPMVRLELQYLYEIGRVSLPPAPVLDELNAVMGLDLCHMPFAAVIRAAEEHGWARDPFDRLIVAQADLAEASLVTRDDTIHLNYSRAVW